MARRIREEIIDDVDPGPTVHRVVTERRVGGYGWGMGGNPAALMFAVILAVFILVLIFGFLV